MSTAGREGSRRLQQRFNLCQWQRIKSLFLHVNFV